MRRITAGKKLLFPSKNARDKDFERKSFWENREGVEWSEWCRNKLKNAIQAD